MGLRKYGWVMEIKEVDDDGYFPYALVPERSPDGHHQEDDHPVQR